jgi:hypothetical protein
MKLQIICVAYHRAIPLRMLIDCFLIQTNPHWQMYIVHDGNAPQDVKDVVSSYDDHRITFIETPKRAGIWGHENRQWALREMPRNDIDYVLITNDDNYYVPTFVERFLEKCQKDVGFVYCNTVHSYMDYDVLQTRIKEGMIDMGSFIVRLSIAKKIGFNYMHEQGDGRYAEDCALECLMHQLGVIYIPKCYFIHN